MLLYIIFIAGGILLLIFSILHLQSIKAYVRCCERVTGQVVRQEEINDNDGIYYCPVFEFTTHAGTTIEYRHWLSSSNPKDWPVGATQIFLYDPDNPASARFLDYGIFKLTVLLTGVSLGLITIGSGYFLLHDLLSL